jgi:hypothetical protein
MNVVGREVNVSRLLRGHPLEPRIAVRSARAFPPSRDARAPSPRWPIRHMSRCSLVGDRPPRFSEILDAGIGGATANSPASVALSILQSVRCPSRDAVQDPPLAGSPPRHRALLGGSSRPASRGRPLAGWTSAGVWNELSASWRLVYSCPPPCASGIRDLRRRAHSPGVSRKPNARGSGSVGADHPVVGADVEDPVRDRRVPSIAAEGALAPERLARVLARGRERIEPPVLVANVHEPVRNRLRRDDAADPHPAPATSGSTGLSTKSRTRRESRR